MEKQFPRTMVGGKSLSRMIIGTNWMAGWSHTGAAADAMIKERHSTPDTLIPMFEKFLEESTLPDRMKQQMRENVVNIVKNYNKFVIGKEYNEETRLELYDFFRTQLSTFVRTQGIFYSYVEDK